MRKQRWIVFALGVVIAFAGPAMADHVINFTNGTSLPVRAYRIDGDMVHVDLGGNAFMAFPMELVDKIENPSRSLNLKPSTMHPGDAGPMIAASSQGGPRTRGGAGSSGSKPQGQQSRNPGIIQPEQPGTAPDQATNAYSQYNAVDSGAYSVINSRGTGGMRGARRVGDKFVLPGQESFNEPPQEIQIRDSGPGAIRPGATQPNPGTEPPRTQRKAGK